MIVFVDGLYDHIRCNVCGTQSPPARELIDGHGLTGLGWRVSGGVHCCPDHVDQVVEPASPLYLVRKGKKLVADEERG